MRVARKKVIVKRFDAIQSLGAVEILCSDKTGTLTTDVVQLSASLSNVGTLSDLPLKLAYVNSALQTGTRSPLDKAIVEHVRQMIEGGDASAEEYLILEKWTKVSEVPFDSLRRLLSVFVSREFAGADEKGLLITKGAVEEVLDRCVQVYDFHSSSSGTWDQFKPGDSPPLTVETKQQILATAARLNEDGLRLVAVACRSTVAMQCMMTTPGDERDLVFVGFLAFLDPVKPDAAEAIEALASLGVQVSWSHDLQVWRRLNCYRSGFSQVTPQLSLRKLLGLSVFFRPRPLFPTLTTSSCPSKLESMRKL